MKEIEKIEGSLINGMTTCNAGVLFKIKHDIYESMSPKYSGHRDNIVSLYINSDGKKVELSAWKINNKFKYGIAYYKHLTDLHSIRYTNNIPKKWSESQKMVASAFEIIFKDK